MERIRIGDACEILNGYAFRSEKYVADGIRIIRIANVQKGHIEDNTPAFYPLESPDVDKYLLEEGDLLMSLTGNVGRVAILERQYLPAALNQRVACLRLKTDKISKGYLFHILNSDYFELQCIQSSKGVAQKNMSTEWLKDFEIPLYSKEEQSNIERILDKARNIITARQQELHILDDLIKARFVEMFGDPVTNSKGWRVAPWEGVFDTKTGKLDSNAAVEGGDYPFFTCAKDWLWIDKYAYDCEALLLAGNNAAGVYDVKHYKGKFNAYQRTYILQLKDEDWSYSLFKYQLEDRLLYLQSQSKGTNTRYLTMGILNSLAFIVPPKELQDEFAAFVAQVDKSKVAVQKALDEAQLLFDSLMQKYFG